jgi:hypothetical protein
LTIPTIYIPVINHHVFITDPITWEWGIVGVGLVVFIILGESYKMGKRCWLRYRKLAKRQKLELSQKISGEEILDIEQVSPG